MPEEPALALAVSVALLRDGALLLVKRGRPPAQNMFAFPGGRVEQGESLEAAARRELHEETGLEAGALAPLRLFHLPGDGNPAIPRYALTVFTGQALPGEPRAGDDAAEAAFFTLEGMRGLPVTPSVLAVAEEILAPSP